MSAANKDTGESVIIDCIVWDVNNGTSPDNISTFWFGSSLGKAHWIAWPVPNASGWFIYSILELSDTYSLIVFCIIWPYFPTIIPIFSGFIWCAVGYDPICFIFILLLLVFYCLYPYLLLLDFHQDFLDQLII